MSGRFTISSTSPNRMASASVSNVGSSEHADNGFRLSKLPLSYFIVALSNIRFSSIRSQFSERRSWFGVGTKPDRLTALPAELVFKVVAYLDPCSKLSLSSTSRRLRALLPLLRVKKLELLAAIECRANCPSQQPWHRSKVYRVCEHCVRLLPFYHFPELDDVRRNHPGLCDRQCFACMRAEEITRGSLDGPRPRPDPDREQCADENTRADAHLDTGREADIGYRWIMSASVRMCRHCHEWVVVHNVNWNPNHGCSAPCPAHGGAVDGQDCEGSRASKVMIPQNSGLADRIAPKQLELVVARLVEQLDRLVTRAELEYILGEDWKGMRFAEKYEVDMIYYFLLAAERRARGGKRL